MKAEQDWITLDEVLAMLPAGRAGSKRHRQTIVGWIEKGLPGPGGEPRVWLKGTKIGNMWFTTKEWVEVFLEAMTYSHE